MDLAQDLAIWILKAMFRRLMDQYGTEVVLLCAVVCVISVLWRVITTPRPGPPPRWTTAENDPKAPIATDEATPMLKTENVL